LRIQSNYSFRKYLESDLYKDTKNKAEDNKEKLYEVKKNNATLREVLINAIDDDQVWCI